jgi:hypothetical protein
MTERATAAGYSGIVWFSPRGGLSESRRSAYLADVRQAAALRDAPPA